jgi:hypothetical protein
LPTGFLPPSPKPKSLVTATSCRVFSRYPVGLSAYDWAIQEKLFEPRSPEQYEAGFIQHFTTASQEHYHYEAGRLA